MAKRPRRHTVLAAIAVLAFAPSSAQLKREVWDTVITDQICGGLFMVPLEWNRNEGETHELLAVFDTGASSTFIDPDSLERISGMRLETGTRAVMQNVSVAGLNFSKFRPRVRDLDHIGQALGRGFDVLLPFKAFQDFLLTLDYGNNEMRIARGPLTKRDGDQIYSSKGRDSRPWIKIKVGSRTRKLLIDSGSNGTISVGPHRSIKFSGETARIRLAQGMSDLELIEVGRYDGVIRVGPLDFDKPIVSLANDTELLGYDVLRHFEVTFDQQNRKVRLRPISSSPVEMEPRTGTGALLRPRKDSLEIAHVVPGSPAETSGLQVGDQVTRIDGVPVNERGCRNGQPELGPIEYTILRDSVEKVISIENSILLE